MLGNFLNGSINSKRCYFRIFNALRLVALVPILCRIMIEIFVENKIVKLKGKSNAFVHLLLTIMAFRFLLILLLY